MTPELFKEIWDYFSLYQRGQLIDESDCLFNDCTSHDLNFKEIGDIIDEESQKEWWDLPLSFRESIIAHITHIIKQRLVG